MYKGCFLLRISLTLSFLSRSIEKKDGFILPIPPLIICIPKIHGQCITMKNYAIYLFQKKIDIPLPMKRPCPTNIEQLLCEQTQGSSSFSTSSRHLARVGQRRSSAPWQVLHSYSGVRTLPNKKDIPGRWVFPSERLWLVAMFSCSDAIGTFNLIII